MILYYDNYAVFHYTLFKEMLSDKSFEVKMRQILVFYIRKVLKSTYIAALGAANIKTDLLIFGISTKTNNLHELLKDS